MARCPFAEWKPIPENATQPDIRPRAVIAHSAGGEGELYGWWTTKGTNVESHFWIGRDGRTVQYIDTEVRADANGQANSFAISIETASSKHATERWDPLQAAALVRLIDWCCTTHDIPREQMVKPTSSGLGWHVMFGAPGPWTPSKGKVCPGPARIAQYQAEIIPAVARLGTIVHPTPPPTEDPLMALTDEEQRELLDKVRGTDLRVQWLENEHRHPDKATHGGFVRTAWSILKRLDPKK